MNCQKKNFRPSLFNQSTKFPALGCVHTNRVESSPIQSSRTLESRGVHTDRVESNQEHAASRLLTRQDSCDSTLLVCTHPYATNWSPIQRRAESRCGEKYRTYGLDPYLCFLTVILCRNLKGPRARNLFGANSQFVSSCGTET